MLTPEFIRGLRSNQVRTYDRVEITFKDLYTRIVEKIRNASLDISLENEDFEKIAKDTITDYVYKKKPYVQGYVRDGQLLITTLINDLINQVTSWGKLTIAKEDPEIREIQINGRMIFVDRKNGYELLKDYDDNVIMFDSPEEGLDFIKARLLFSKKRLTVEEPLVNATTIEGWRIAATHPCINPPHPDEPTLQWATAVIRKIGGKVFDKSTLVSYKTACPEMLDWLSLTGEGLIGNTIAGTTGCGKTTIFDYTMHGVRDADRVACLQSPTEYHYRHMVDGIQQNNAVYFEVNPDARQDTTRSATINNLVSQTLRYTISALGQGELKDTCDFTAGARALNAGTKNYNTLHTFDIPGIIDRFALEYVNGMGMDYNIAKNMACRYLGPLTLCDRLGDGSRKVMGCAEVLGYIPTSDQYIINYLYEFVLVDTVLRDGVEGELGMVWNVGFFVKRGNISKATQTQILKKLPKSKILPLLETPIGQVLMEVNYDKLPLDYIIEYDSDIIPLENSQRKYKHRLKEENIGVQLC